MIDGIYRVKTGSICAYFIIRDGKVKDCAPVLRKNIKLWAQGAEYIGPEKNK